MIMNILKIKELTESRAGGLKKLAKDIGMSEANLHRCIKANKIQANDLEKIASIFNVPVGYFFDESARTEDKNVLINELRQEIRRLKNIIAKEGGGQSYVLVAVPVDSDSGEYIDLRDTKDISLKILKR
jgi:DNA-binding Xre family transcriptional regulator